MSEVVIGLIVEGWANLVPPPAWDAWTSQFG